MSTRLQAVGRHVLLRKCDPITLPAGCGKHFPCGQALVGSSSAAASNVKFMPKSTSYHLRNPLGFCAIWDTPCDPDDFCNSPGCSSASASPPAAGSADYPKPNSSVPAATSGNVSSTLDVEISAPLLPGVGLYCDLPHQEPKTQAQICTDMPALLIRSQAHLASLRVLGIGGGMCQQALPLSSAPVMLDSPIN